MITEPSLQAPSRSRAGRIALAAALGAVGLVAAGLIGAAQPSLSPFGTGMPGLLGLLDGAVATWVEAAVGALALIGLAACAGTLRRERPAPAARVVTGALGLAAALTMPGSAIAGAGYLLALVVLLAAPILLVVLAVRRPALGLPLLAVLAGGLAAGELTGAFQVSAFLGVFVSGIGGAWLTLVATAAHTLTGLALLALAVRAPSTRSADAVRRARVPVTIAAAACALPYIVARASWLTPWPLFGPSREMLDDSPATMATGLLLGTAMVVGAVLTLGLILPWGERFPRWLPRVGGRPVPVPLAVVPALLVAVLFTVGGVGLLDLGAAAQGVDAQGTGAPLFASLTMALMLPFWLWGPLLALATWGYALHRHELVRP